MILLINYNYPLFWKFFKGDERIKNVMYIRIIYGVVRSFFYFSHIGMDVYRNIRVIREDKGLEFGVKNLIKKKYNTDYKYNSFNIKSFYIAMMIFISIRCEIWTETYGVDNNEIEKIKSYLLGIRKDCWISYVSSI